MEKDLKKRKMEATQRKNNQQKLLNEMIYANKMTKKMQDENFYDKSVNKDKERKLRGTLGRVQKFTSPQVAHMVDNSHNKAI